MCGTPHHQSAVFCGMCGARFPETSPTPKPVKRPFNYALAWCYAAFLALFLCSAAIVIGR